MRPSSSGLAPRLVRRLVPALALGGALSVGALSVGGLAGCGKPAPGPFAFREVELATLTDAQRAQQKRADDARTQLFGRLMGRLSDELEKGGPAGAIGVCREEAPAIAAAISRETGVRIGRTSHRLRNPKNAPPDWARPLVEQQRATPAVFAAADGRLAVWSPIRLLPNCLMCHGEPDALDAGVRAALARDYPDDRATGFKTNDLRGAFWIEVPGP